MYNILSETIINKISANNIPTVNLESLNVSTAEFNNYLNNIRTVDIFSLKNSNLFSNMSSI